MTPKALINYFLLYNRTIKTDTHDVQSSESLYHTVWVVDMIQTCVENSVVAMRLVTSTCGRCPVSARKLYIQT